MTHPKTEAWRQAWKDKRQMVLEYSEEWGYWFCSLRISDGSVIHTADNSKEIIAKKIAKYTTEMGIPI